jgi:hypothetical protein
LAAEANRRAWLREKFEDRVNADRLACVSKSLGSDALAASRNREGADGLSKSNLEQHRNIKPEVVPV